ncbi:MAG: ABC-2 family transporter protein [Acidobacteriota bacterium]
MGHYATLAGLFVKVHFKAQLEYRQAFIMRYVVQLISRGVELLGIWILLTKFEHINGWTFYEVMFLFGLNLLSYGLAGVVFFGPMLDLERLVRTGELDSLLIAPLDTLFHLVGRYFSSVFFGHILLGSTILGLAIFHLDLRVGPGSVLFFAAVVLGAALLQGAVMLAAGSVSFWLVKSRALVNTVVHGVRSFIVYPISIYDNWVQVVLTLVLPFAFVSFFPAEHFLDKPGSSIFPAVFQWGTPLVGAVFFLLAYRLWCLGVDGYQSTGS